MPPFRKDPDNIQRERMEDALKHLLECAESGRGATVESLAGALSRPRGEAAEILGQLRGRGLALASEDTHHLTTDGRNYAVQVVRSHRLYETWLARETSMPAENWHREAHKAEHHLEAAEVDALADRLSNPRFDPHGDPIPTREGQLPQRRLSSLASWPDDQPARIEHIEDEPEALFRLAQQAGLSPGSLLDGIKHLSDGAVTCHIEGRTISIPASVVTLVHVAEPQVDELPPADIARLSDLRPGGEAIVHGLSPSCTGAERHRLLDLGVVPGTPIRCAFASPFGSPRSYEIRGAMIALRDHQAERILVHSLTGKSATPA